MDVNPTQPLITSSGDKAMIPIRTLAFFDLEATDLMSECTHSKKVHITELSIVAVSAAALKSSSPQPPRVKNKLTMCVCPRATIHPVATRLTGLDNFILEHEPTFDTDTCDALVKLFLLRLPQPVCLVAHGLFYDFELLNQELNQLNKNLPDGTLCVDTVPFFQQLQLNDFTLEKMPKRNLGEFSDKPSASGDCGPNKLKNEIDTAAEVLKSPNASSLKPPIKKGRLSTPEKLKTLDHLVEQLAPRFKSETLHTAEGDALALLHCISPVVNKFIPWMNENAKSLDKMKKC